MASGTFNLMPIPTSRPIRISIVIPTLGRPSLCRLLNSIESSIFGLDLEYQSEIEIVVAGDSRVSLSHLPTMDFVRQVSSPGPGVNRARNAGARASRGTVLWFLDDDTEIFDKDVIQRIFRIISDPQVIAAGGDYRSTTDARFAERGYNAVCSLWRNSAGIENREILLGGNLLVQKKYWNLAGEFDENIEYGGSETPFVQRLNRIASGEPTLRVIFDRSLDIFHRPARRGIRGWLKVALIQGRRRADTVSEMPSLKKRFSRSFQALSWQSPKGILALIIFGVPFLLVSQIGARHFR